MRTRFHLYILILAVALPMDPHLAAQTDFSGLFKGSLDRREVSAIEGKRDTELKSLLAAGARADVLGRDNLTPLMVALLSANKTAFRLLIENGANPNVQITTHSPALGKLRIGDSVTSVAARAADVWYLQLVLEHGGNPNLVNRVDGFTPVFEVVQLYEPQALRMENLTLLLKAGGNLNVNDNYGMTPVVWAASCGRYDMVYAMLVAGADLSVGSEGKLSLKALMERTRSAPGHPMAEWRMKVVALLKAKGTDIR